MKITHFLTMITPSLFFAGCSTPGVTDTTDLDGPVTGPADVTKFVAATDGSAVGLSDLTKVAKTIRKYKNLGANDQEIIRRVASLKLDGLVASQMQILAPVYEKKKTVVREVAKAKKVAVRRSAVAAGRAEPEVAREVAKVAAEETREIAQIDLDWQSAARAQVARNYGTDFAVPVQNAEGKAVVAFASMKESGVSVSAASYQIDGTSRQLLAAAAGQQKVSHEGRDYTLLDSSASLQ